jgi:hypothetical protein
MNKHLATEFLRRLYAGVPEDEWLTLFAMDRLMESTDENNRRIRWSRVVELDQLVDEAEKLSDRCCVWYGVATRRTRLTWGRGGEDDCLSIPALFADIDVQGPGHKSDKLPPSEKDALKMLEHFDEPSMIVRSGGGLQPYWLLDAPLSVEEVRPILADWAYNWREIAESYGWSIDNIFEPARILRLPGTFNRKPSLEAPLEVTVEF